MPGPAPERSVLIVGAGPTGLLLGADLARRGVDCRIVEEADVRLTAPRAINVHPRSLEVFADLGIAEEALALGHRVPHLNAYASREPAPGRAPRHLGRVSMNRLPSPFPFTLTLQQPVTERLLEESAARYGVKVERRVCFAGLTQDDAGVIAQLEHLDDGTTEAVRFSWVVGCDGIGSTVRAAAGIPFEGKAYDDDLASADVELTWRYPHDEAHVFLSAAGTLRCMPVPGEQRWRIVADLPPQPAGREREELTLSGYERMMRERGVDVTLEASHWMADFHIQKRIATRYRAGRVLLAGDAAHVHSPSGAQGMNLGMQDAYNLGWKLAQVVAGAAAPELLDTYERERRPVALHTLETTDRSVRQLGLRNPIRRAWRNTTTTLVLHLGPLQRRLAQGSAQLRTHYRSSPLAVERWPARRLPSFAPGSSGPRAGDRVPEVRFGPPGDPCSSHRLLKGTGYVLLLFADDSAAAAVKLARLPDQIAHERARDITWYLVVRDAAAAQWLRLGDRVLVDPDGALHAGWGAPAGSLYLIRPDGYIGYREWSADAVRLDDYLRGVLT